MRKASAAGNNDRSAKLSSRYEKAGGNAEKTNARITKRLHARDMRIQQKPGSQGGNAPRKAAASRNNARALKRAIPYDKYAAKQKPSKPGSSFLRSAGSALGSAGSTLASHAKSYDSLVGDIGANRKKSSYK